MEDESDIAQLPATTSLKPKADEVFRGLWASIFYSGRSAGKTVLVCSADRQEGASTIAAGLALGGCEPEGIERVALVDFNLRAPSLHDIFELSEAPGVCEVICDGQPLESVAQRINNSLDLYSVGRVDGRMLQVLRSDALDSFFESLRNKYDRVIVDAAAGNHYPDAQVLGGKLKEIVMVAHSGQTPREAVAQAAKRLEAGGGKIIGLVLNLRTYPIPKFLYRRA